MSTPKYLPIFQPTYLMSFYMSPVLNCCLCLYFKDRRMNKGRKFEGIFTEAARQKAIEAIAESNMSLLNKYLKQLRQSCIKANYFVGQEGRQDKREQTINHLLSSFKKEFGRQRYDLIAHRRVKEIQEEQWKQSQAYQDQMYVQKVMKKLKGEEQQQKKADSRSQQQEKENKGAKVENAGLLQEKKEVVQPKVENKTESTSNERPTNTGNNVSNNSLASKNPAKLQNSNSKPTQKPSLPIPKTQSKPAQVQKKMSQGPAKTQSADNAQKSQPTPGKPFGNSFSYLSTKQQGNSLNFKMQSMFGNTSNTKYIPFSNYLNNQKANQALPIKQDTPKPNIFMSTKPAEKEMPPLFGDFTNEKKNNLLPTQTKQSKKEPKRVSPFAIAQPSSSHFSSATPFPNNIFSTNNQGSSLFGTATLNNLKPETANNAGQADNKNPDTNIFGKLPSSQNNIFKSSSFSNNLATGGSNIFSIGGGISAILQSNKGSSINQGDQQLINQLAASQTKKDSKPQGSQLLDRVTTSMDSSSALFKES